MTQYSSDSNVIYLPFSDSDEKMTFQSIALEWLFDEISNEITSRTCGQYYATIVNHLLPLLANSNINAIEFSTVCDYFNHLANEKARTAELAIDLFIRIMHYACDKGYCYHSLPLHKLKKVNTTTEGQADLKYIPQQLREKVITLASDHDILYPILITGMFIGLRPGELIALKWNHVNFKAGRIKIIEAMTYELEIDATNGITKKTDIISDTKTEAGVRNIVAPSIVLKALARWKAYCICRKIYDPDGYVFVTQQGEMRSYTGLLSLFRRFSERNKADLLGIQITPHMLRHTCATILLENKVNPKIVQKILGHAHVTTTLKIYSHVSEDVLLAVANKLDNVYEQIINKSYQPTV